MKLNLQLNLKQSGAVEACWAHNPEVRRSKLRSATISFFFFFFPFARKRYPTNFKVPLSCFDVFSSLWLRRGVYCHSHTFIQVNKEEEKHKSSHLTVLKGSFLVNVHQIKKFNNSVGGGGFAYSLGSCGQATKNPQKEGEDP